MSKGGGGGGGGTQTVTQKVELPPWVDAAAQKNLNQAYNVSQNMAGPYTGARYAAITDGMGADIAGLQANVGSTNPAFALAQNGAQGVMNYRPGNVTAGTYNAATIGDVPQIGAQQVAAERIGAERIGADQISPQTLANANYAAYMNPYTTSVVDYGLKALETQRQQALNGIADNAIKTRAFGGSRQGVAEGVLNAGAALNAGKLASDLMSQNFLQGQAAATGDITRNLAAQQANQAANLTARQSNQATGLQAAQSNQATGLQAALANQAANLTAEQTNLQALMQSALANQSAMNSASQFNVGNNLQAQLANQAAGLQGAGLNLNAANQLGALAGQGQEAYLSGLRSAMAGQGIIQQNGQAQMDAAKQAWTEGQQFPLQQLQIPLMALGMTPYGQTTTTTGPAQPQQSSNGFLQGLGGLASIIGMGGSLFGAGGMFPGALAGLSDETEKTDMKKVGKDPDTGLDLYAYRYKGDPKTYPKVVGPLAQDIAEKYPDQVAKVGNKLAVNLGFPSMRKAFH